MEAFTLYFLKSVIWLSGFTLVYFLFLRNERFFRLNRYYLIAGAIISFVFPLFTFHYGVEIPAFTPTFEGPAPAPSNFSGLHAGPTGPGNKFNLSYILLTFYFSGICFFLYKMLSHLKALFNTIGKANFSNHERIRLVRTSEFSDSFSFFNYIFINPSVNENELDVIMNHELVHVNQKHWFDLCLVELLRLFQWVNPFAWIYTRLMRQNHEYIADEIALQHTPDQLVYRAVLVNRLFDSEVISLSNSFNYSFNKKRFDMMKKIVTSPYRKMKVLLVLPVFAIVFYAFAEPEYHHTSQTNSTGSFSQLSSEMESTFDQPLASSDMGPSMNLQKKEVRGYVVQQDGTPLPGAAVIVKETTMGTSSDIKGYFKLVDVPEDGSLVISFVGFRTRNVDYDFSSEMRITMVNDTLNYGNLRIVDKEGKEAHPLVVLDGVETEKDIKDIDSWTIYSISVLKDKAASDKYGEKGKNGVIEITTKQKEIQDNAKLSDSRPGGSSKIEEADEDLFMVVEELPEFPGGRINLNLWLSQNMKYPVEARDKKITGKVFVDFVVTSKGKITGIKVYKPVHPLLDAEAIRLIGSMPDWKPGSQSGKTVNVSIRLPIEFN
jgi:TonB family protein